jgi:anti-anti-sigma factor
MTVVPDDTLMRLICDTCGDTVAGPACVLPDAEVVWTFVSEHGWSGSPFATGPHRCPRCSRAPMGGDRPDRRQAGRHHQPAGNLGIDYLDEVAVVTATGDLNVDTGDILHAALSAAVTIGRDVLVDLTHVHLIDSAGLGVLVRAHRDARDRDGLLCLAAPSRFVRTVLHTMRLDGVFLIFDSRQEALDRLGAPRAASRTTVTATSAVVLT